MYPHARKIIPIFEKNKGGRPPELDIRHERKIIRNTKFHRDKEANFSLKRVRVMADVPNVSGRTVDRVMNKHGYGYRESKEGSHD